MQELLDELKTRLNLNNKKELIEKIEVRTDPFKGSCVEFKEYIKNVGLKGVDGNLKNRFGRTDPAIRSHAEYDSKRVNCPLDKDCKFEAYNIRFKFKGEVVVTCAEWIPKKTDISRQCEELKIEWERNVVEHETRHVYDFINILSSANRKVNQEWKGKSLTASGSDCKTAEENLKQKIKKAREDEVKKINEEIKKKIEEFHKSPGGGPAKYLNCRTCG